MSNNFLEQTRKARELGLVLMWDWVGVRWIVGDNDKVKMFSRWVVVIKDFGK